MEGVGRGDTESEGEVEGGGQTDETGSRESWDNTGEPGPETGDEPEEDIPRERRRGDVPVETGVGESRGQGVGVCDPRRSYML